MKLKWLFFTLPFALNACVQEDIEGTYQEHDGEFVSATMILRSGKIQFWPGDTDIPPITGTYRQEGKRVTLSIAGQTETAIIKNGCLYPEDNPDQKICKR